jgi:hypothetical protein
VPKSLKQVKTDSLIPRPPFCPSEIAIGRISDSRDFFKTIIVKFGNSSVPDIQKKDSRPGESQRRPVVTHPWIPAFAE